MPDVDLLASLIKVAYPQALVKLIYQLKDIQLAEDNLQSACEKALNAWQKETPDNPVAWLIKVAINCHLDFLRRQKHHTSLPQGYEPSWEPDLSEEALVASYNDDMLRLLFTCCHPALNQSTQIILALKHLLGLDVQQIANALLLKRTTVQQRLLRAKQKISANGIQYQTPSERQWPERLQGVLKSIYLLFNEGYVTSEVRNVYCPQLCAQAIGLARMLQAAIRNNAEITGLLALLLAQDARSPARSDSFGNQVLLADQDRSLWKSSQIQEANSLVEKALKMDRANSYALQAAIACLHNNAKCEATTDWSQIDQLYRILATIDNNPVVRLNGFVAQAKAGELDLAIEGIKTLESQLDKYFYYYASLAGLLNEKGQARQAQCYYQQALKLAKTSSEKSFIQAQLANT